MFRILVPFLITVAIGITFFTVGHLLGEPNLKVISYLFFGMSFAAISQVLAAITADRE